MNLEKGDGKEEGARGCARRLKTSYTANAGEGV